MSSAILSQLAAEFTAHNITIKDVASEIEKDYNTFRRYVTGEREMPISVLLSALNVLQLDPVVFMRRAQERATQAAE